MQINYDDIRFLGDLAVNGYIQDLIKEEMDLTHPLSAEAIIKLKNKYKDDNIFKNDFAMDVVKLYVGSCITEYHDQLRKVLQEQLSVDIGAIDYTTVPGPQRAKYNKLKSEEH